jgi:hypothetical protein
LRSAIGKYLEAHQGVKGFAPGDVMRGGRGITVVELRQRRRFQKFGIGPVFWKSSQIMSP